MPQRNERRYLICTCGVVYERKLEYLDTHTRGRFACPCGTSLGAWNGIIRLTYQPVSAPDEHILCAARPIAA